MKQYKLLVGGVLILALVVSIIFISTPYKNVDTYLEKNHADLNLEDENDFSGLEILSKDLEGKKVILTGEVHNLDKNHDMFLKLVKYIQMETGFNYILEEIGYADAYFHNKYLETGDESILEEYFDIYKEQKLGTEERYNDYVELYNFNQTLPKDQRLKFVGVDVESKATYDYLIDVVGNQPLTEELELLISKLENFNYYAEGSYKNILNVLDKLNEDIENNEEEYKSIFKDEFEGFKFALRNLEQFSISNLRRSEGHYFTTRDKYIYENFKLVDSYIEDGVYFGQWGGLHILQDTLYNTGTTSDVDYLASLLDKDEQYKDKVLSIQYAYTTDKNTHNHNVYSINKNLFSNYLSSESSSTIFKLNGMKSPFVEEYIHPFSSDSSENMYSPTTEYYQYMILLRNSVESKTR